MPRDFDYFLAFYRQKIKDGVKQNDLSSYLNRSPQYLSKMYTGKPKEPKSCPLKVQQGVAEYFKLSYKEMISEGREIYGHESSRKINSGATEAKSYNINDPDVQKKLLKRVEDGITKNSNKLVALKKKINVFEIIFKQLDEGVTFFDDKRNFVYSSNRWHFLDDVDLEDNPTIENIVINIRKKISNLDEVIDTVYKVASNPKKEEKVDVYFKNGYVFNFRVVPIFEDSAFLGTLLINTLKSIPEENT